MSNPTPHLQLDLATNSLVLTVDPPLPQDGPADALLDLANRGVLLGVDLGDCYVALASPSSGVAGHERTARIQVMVRGNGRQLVIPRRGAGWEISYPSGNQCWRSTEHPEGVDCDVIPAVVTRD